MSVELPPRPDNPLEVSSVLDLPEPDGPITATYSPSSMRRIAAPYGLIALGAVPVPALDGPVHAGSEAVLGVIRTSVSPNALLTFLAPEDTIGDAHDAPTLNRLRAVKRAVDPRGMIRSNYPVLTG